MKIVSGVKTFLIIPTLIKRSVTSVKARNRKEFFNIWELANKGHQIIYFAQNYCDYCIGTANGSMIPGLTDCLE